MHSIIDFVVIVIARLKKNQRIKATTPSLRVNIGAGLTVAPSWINIDMSFNSLVAGKTKPLISFLYHFAGAKQWYSKQQYIEILSNHHFVHHDVRYGLPFADNTVDFIYSSHFLEHLYRSDAAYFLRESFRVLRPNGLIRVCVPDLEYAIKLYTDMSDKEKALSYFFSSSPSRNLSSHRFMYDFELLKKTLENAGFVDVKKHAYQQGQVPDVEVLDNRSEETLYVEARKAADPRIISELKA